MHENAVWLAASARLWFPVARYLRSVLLLTHASKKNTASACSGEITHHRHNSTNWSFIRLRKWFLLLLFQHAKRAKRQMQTSISAEWTTLSRIDCFIHGDGVGFEVLLNATLLTEALHNKSWRKHTGNSKERSRNYLDVHVTVRTCAA